MSFAAGARRDENASSSKMLPKVRRAPLGLFPKHPRTVVGGRLIIVKVAPNEAGIRRYGVVVSRAVARCAVERNRLKRATYRILSAVSEKRAEDVMVILKPPAAAASEAALRDELLRFAG